MAVSGRIAGLLINNNNNNINEFPGFHGNTMLANVLAYSSYINTYNKIFMNYIT